MTRAAVPLVMCMLAACNAIALAFSGYGALALLNALSVAIWLRSAMSALFDSSQPARDANTKHPAPSRFN